jgi:L-threonylcarbamoyladenylate synthase
LSGGGFIAEVSSGDVIAFPTETFFAVGCDPRSKQGVDRLIELKSRPDEAGFPLIISNPTWIEQYIVEPIELRRLRLNLQQKFWPGPLTIVFATNEKAQKEIQSAVFGPEFSLAVRLSPLTIAHQTAEAFGGAVISTSANPRGQAPRKTAVEVRDYFPELRIVEAECGGAAKPSTIVDLRKLPLRVLRDGEISAAEVLAVAV